MKLVYGVPWDSEFILTRTMESLLQLRQPLGWETSFVRGKGWCPARRHIHLCEQAVEQGADYVLILGADQMYEPDLLERLTARVAEGYQCLAALVPTRGHIEGQGMRPFQPVAWRFKSSDQGVIRQYRGMALDSDMVEVLRPDTGMQRAHFIGSGVLLFHVDDLLALPRPWFSETINLETYARLANMDCTFVWRLQMLGGAKLWVDTDIHVKHAHVFEIDNTYQHRFETWDEPGMARPLDFAKARTIDSAKALQEA